MYKTREEWLTAAAVELWEMIEQAGAARVKVKASVGFPSRNALSVKNKTIGQCWAAACSADGSAQIFISPSLCETTRVLDVLAHEMIHAATPGCGHKGAFVKVCRALGLEGKPTATVAGAELSAKLSGLAMRLGEYPHPEFNPMADTERKKQSTRLLKVVCADEACGYTVRVTAKWIDVGFPTCPCGTGMQAEE